ncbi:catalytic subunit of DNA polymerase delta [Chloropicon primus]|nr:catalytic subunit of DNA polymerase delta [Chloropicon primus]
MVGKRGGEEEGKEAKRQNTGVGGMPGGSQEEEVDMDVERELLEEENEQDMVEAFFDDQKPSSMDAPSLEDGDYGRNWCRPPLEEDQLDASTQPLVFQQIECDYTIQRAHKDFVPPELKGASVPVVRMYGVNRSGNSVCAFVHGFEPYFYVELPGSGFTPDDVDAFRQSLEKEIINSRGGGVTSGFKSVTRIEVEQKKSLWGYNPGQNKPFLKVTTLLPQFVSKSRTIIERGLNIPGLGHRAFRTYESNVLFILRFMIDCKIVGGNWLEFPKGSYQVRQGSDKATYSQLEVDVRYDSIVSHASEGEFMDLAKLRILSIDIECAGRKGHFPEAEIDPVIQIANMLTVQGEPEPRVRNILTLGSCAPIVGSEVMSFDKEAELLKKWADLVRKTDPDIIIGYNILKFDLPYLIDRANKLGVKEFSYLGRVKNSVVRMRDTVFSSKAYGTRESKEITIEGRVQFDLFTVIQRDHKLSSYSLNNVSATFLGEQKEDVHHSCITDLQNGNEETRRRLAVYCLKDAYLPQRLLDKLMYMYNYIEMARVTGVPLNFLLTRGQSIKVFSQILRKAQERGLLVPALKGGGQQDGVAFEGATVLEANAGYYTKPVATLDFASLYPSIMMAHNLCYCTLLPQSMVRTLNPEDYTKTPSGQYFVKSSLSKGILPEILEELLGARKRAKAELKKAKDEFLKGVLNGRQLALKVSANSVYGFTGATVGKMPCLEISASVTAFGREMIMHTKSLVTQKYCKANGYEFDSEVVYGDSVTADTALLLRDDAGKIETRRIDSISSSWKRRDDGKEVAYVPAVQVMTDTGFAKIEQVVRHKTKKQMYRVVTHNGIVDVTEDHSLLLEDASEVRPVDVQLGTRLLHANLSDIVVKERTLVSKQEAKVMGFFFGDGSCGKYGSGIDTKYSWALSNADYELLLYMQQLCPFPTKLLDTLKSSGVYKLVTVGDVKSVVVKYRAMFYNEHREKIVPQCILNASNEVVQAFWTGYYKADGDRGNLKPEEYHNADYVDMPCVRCDCKGKEGSLGLYLVGQRLGYNVSINTRADKPDIFRLTYTRNTQRRCPTAIKKIVNLGITEQYVYDLTTSNSHFHVGPGRMVVHNTDSVMIKFGNKDLKKSMDLGEEAAQYVSDTFVKPIKLEFEKCYFPYLLISKKRYAGLLWTETEKYDKMDTKGIETVRRDNCALVRNVVSSCLEKVLIEQDVEGAVSYVKRTISDLLQNKLDMSLLVVTKELSKTSYAAKQAHVELAEKMRKRDAATAPQLGDRVPYVIIKGLKGAKAYEKAEDPIYALENKLPIDYAHYVDHHLSLPLMRIFEPIIKNPKSLLVGEHTRKVVNPTGRKTGGGMMGFLTVGAKCLGCKTPLPKGAGNLCKHCKSQEADIYTKEVRALRDLEAGFNRLWTQCQRCSGSLHQDVLCTARDCPIFYRRKKTQVDLVEQQEKVNTFSW